MSIIRVALIALVTCASLARAQSDPDRIPNPPSAGLARLQPFFGSFAVTGHYFGQDWAGSLDIRPAIKGWYVEWEYNVHSGPIDRTLRMMLTWDADIGAYRIWRFETSPPAPRERSEGTGRFVGDEFVMEWREPAPDGTPGTFRNRTRAFGRDSVVTVSEGIPDNGSGRVVPIGVTTGRRRM